jgi:hypothetical protein
LEIGNAITSFIRVPVSAGLRLPERVKAEDQKANLLKGGHGRMSRESAHCGIFVSLYILKAPVL